MMAAKPQLGEPNKDLVSYLSGIVQTKQDLVQNQATQITAVLSREKELKNKLEELEFLYDLDPNKNMIKYKTENTLPTEMALPFQTNNSSDSFRKSTGLYF